MAAMSDAAPVPVDGGEGGVTSVLTVTWALGPAV
jgi:hypothetical protein